MGTQINIDRLEPVSDELIRKAQHGFSDHGIMIETPGGRYTHRRPAKRRGKWFVRNHGWCEIAGAENKALWGNQDPLYLFRLVCEVNYQRAREDAACSEFGGSLDHG